MSGDATPWVEPVLIVDDGPDRAAAGNDTVTGLSAAAGPSPEIRYFAPEIRNRRAVTCAGGRRLRTGWHLGMGIGLEQTAGIPP